MTIENAIPVYSYHWLCEKMKDRQRVCLRYNLGQIYGVINGMRPEDGSGRHWLVTIVDSVPNAFGGVVHVQNEVYVRAE
jgi:hypothetical protein